MDILNLSSRNLFQTLSSLITLQNVSTSIVTLSLTYSLGSFFYQRYQHLQFLSRHKKSTIIITGASQGVGRSIAIKLSSLLPQSRLILLARTESLLAELAKELGQDRSGPVLYFSCDCSKYDELISISKKIGDPCDIVIANAGVGSWKAIFEEDVKSSETERCLSAPLLSTLHTANAFLPKLIKNNTRGGGGVFLVTQSPASRVVWPGATAYAAARWGLRGVCEALSSELPSHVLVTEVILSEIKDSEYFKNNPGSYERLPWIAPVFGSLTSQDAANAVLYALESKTREFIAPWQLRYGLSFLWIPGMHATFSAIIKATGWKYKVTSE
jgi:uncharacterized protein